MNRQPIDWNNPANEMRADDYSTPHEFRVLIAGNTYTTFCLIVVMLAVWTALVVGGVFLLQQQQSQCEMP